MIIGITGLARSGKDTLCQLLIEQLKRQDKIGERFALADALKSDIDPFLTEKIGISAFTQNSGEKDIIRPLLVAYGKAMRLKSEGTYWTSQLTCPVKVSEDLGHVPIVTDVRYQFYKEDEYTWIANKLKGTLVHVSRYSIDEATGKKIFVEPPNADEAQFDPIMKELAHYRIEWPTTENFGSLKIYVEDFLKFLNDKNHG